MLYTIRSPRKHSGEAPLAKLKLYNDKFPVINIMYKLPEVRGGQGQNIHNPSPLVFPHMLH